MKSLPVLLAICALGYAADHWQELTGRHAGPSGEDPHGLTIYGSKSNSACVQLEHELDKRGIHYQKKNTDDEASRDELQAKFIRVGKSGSRVTMPVVEIDGVLHEGANIGEVTKRLH